MSIDLSESHSVEERTAFLIRYVKSVPQKDWAEGVKAALIAFAAQECAALVCQIHGLQWKIEGCHVCHAIREWDEKFCKLADENEALQAALTEAWKEVAYWKERMGGEPFAERDALRRRVEALGPFLQHSGCGCNYGSRGERMLSPTCTLEAALRGGESDAYKDAKAHLFWNE